MKAGFHAAAPRNPNLKFGTTCSARISDASNSGEAIPRADHAVSGVSTPIPTQPLEDILVRVEGVFQGCGTPDGNRDSR